MEQPLFTLFRTINCHYLYDSNRNNIYPISENVYKDLLDVKNGAKTFDEVRNCSSVISELIENGLLSKKRVQKIEHIYTSLAESLVGRRLQKVTLQLTQNCNFRCAYCHYTSNDGSQRIHSNKKMTLELAKEAIRYLGAHSVDTESVYIGFYGGEPLLEFSLLKEIVLFSDVYLKGKDVHYTITTNGTLLTDEIIEFLSAHKFSLMISLDGPKAIHDRSRVFRNGTGSFDVVINKLYHIFKKYPNFFRTMSINMVLNPSDDFDEINSLFSSYSFLKRIDVSSTLIDDVGASEKNEFRGCYVEKEHYQVFLKYLSLVGRFPFQRCTPIFQNYAGGLRNTLDEISERPSFVDVCAPGGPCVPGESRLMVTVDGDFVPCERVSEISEAMIIGNIRNGIDMEKIYALLNIAKSTSDQCRNCWAFSHCHLCAKYSDKEGALSSEMRLSYCKESQRDALHKLRQYAFVRELKEYYNYSVNV